MRSALAVTGSAGAGTVATGAAVERGRSAHTHTTDATLSNVPITTVAVSTVGHC